MLLDCFGGGDRSELANSARTGGQYDSRVLARPFDGILGEWVRFVGGEPIDQAAYSPFALG